MAFTAIYAYLGSVWFVDGSFGSLPLGKTSHNNTHTLTHISIYFICCGCRCGAFVICARKTQMKVINIRTTWQGLVRFPFPFIHFPTISSK